MGEGGSDGEIDRVFRVRNEGVPLGHLETSRLAEEGQEPCKDGGAC